MDDCGLGSVEPTLASQCILLQPVYKSTVISTAVQLQCGGSMSPVELINRKEEHDARNGITEQLRK